MGIPAAAVVLLVLLAGAAVKAPPPAPIARPNVLLVLFDDMSYRIGLYGFLARTPSLERLAAAGRRFDRAYCPYPLCNPSRTSLFTGWRPERTQVLGNTRNPARWIRGAVPLQEHFARHGYFTAKVGKAYHSRFEKEFRWGQAVDTYEGWGDEPRELLSWGPSRRRAEDLPDGLAVRRATEILARKRDGPFFVVVGFLMPHEPWIVPESFLRQYPPESVSLPRSVSAAAAAHHGPSSGVPPQQAREAIAAYMAAETFADAQLGLLLDALDRLGLREHTVVAALGDNGYHAGEHGQWGKMTLLEESARVPLVIAGPGVERPGVPTEGLVETQDLYPTLIDLCRLPPVPGLDAVSLLPLLHDPAHRVRQTALTIMKVGSARLERIGKSVRTARYRFTRWPDGGEELFDLERDPDELTNLARDPSHAETLVRIRGLLHDRAGPAPSP